MANISNASKKSAVESEQVKQQVKQANPAAPVPQKRSRSRGKKSNKVAVYVYNKYREDILVGGIRFKSGQKTKLLRSVWNALGENFQMKFHLEREHLEVS